MSHLLHPRTSLTGTITYARPAVFGGMTLFRGEDYQGHYRPHVHATWVIGVVESGSMGLAVGGRRYLLTPGSILLLNPYEVHEEFSVGSAGWSFRYFFPGEPSLQVILARWGRAAPLPWFPEPVVRDQRIAGHLIRLHQALLLDAGNPAPAVEAGLADVVRALVEEHGRRGPALAGPGRPVRRVRDHLHEVWGDSLRLEQLARVGRLSRYHLVRLFRREIGLPPHAYYAQLRIARSRELLHEGRPLSEIACLLRYSDQSHFTRQFGESAPVSPGNYAWMVRTPGQRWSFPSRR